MHIEECSKEGHIYGVLKLPGNCEVGQLLHLLIAAQVLFLTV